MRTIFDFDDFEVCLFALFLCTPILVAIVFFFMPPAACPAEIEGLVKVEKHWQNPLKHWGKVYHNEYTYKIKNETRTYTCHPKLKKVPDLRTYEQRHPKRAWVQAFCTRWESTASMGLNIGLPAVAAVKKNGL